MVSTRCVLAELDRKYPDYALKWSAFRLPILSDGRPDLLDPNITCKELCVLESHRATQFHDEKSARVRIISRMRMLSVRHMSETRETGAKKSITVMTMSDFSRHVTARTLTLLYRSQKHVCSQCFQREAPWASVSRGRGHAFREVSKSL